MPYRRIPISDEGRLTALRNAKIKADAVGAECAFSAETKARLETFLPQFDTELTERSTSLQEQTTATNTHVEIEAKLRLYVSHFLQVFNFAIARGVYVPQDRVYYGLTLNQEELPKLSSSNDLETWASNVIDGEVVRTTAGGSAMANPSSAEVATIFDEFKQSKMNQTSKKDAYDKEQEDVDNMRGTADDIIVDIWDEVEFTFRKDTASSKRRKAREYGVVYITRPGEEPEPEGGETE